jgi:hypothetical protein
MLVTHEIHAPAYIAIMACNKSKSRNNAGNLEFIAVALICSTVDSAMFAIHYYATFDIAIVARKKQNCQKIILRDDRKMEGGRGSPTGPLWRNHLVFTQADHHTVPAMCGQFPYRRQTFVLLLRRAVTSNTAAGPQGTWMGSIMCPCAAWPPPAASASAFGPSAAGPGFERPRPYRSALISAVQVTASPSIPCDPCTQPILF